ncbi:hypothetical protein SGPA1_11643 [Streptomyces misionensis JCM 4497]
MRRLPHRRRERQARPARDPARPDPGRRRHPAPAPSGRPLQGQGPHLHRPHGQGRRGPRDRPGGPGRPGRRGLRAGARLGRAARPGPGHRAARRQGGRRHRSGDRPRHRARRRAQLVRGPVRHRGPRAGYAQLRRGGAGQGQVPVSGGEFAFNDRW